MPVGYPSSICKPLGDPSSKHQSVKNKNHAGLILTSPILKFEHFNFEHCNYVISLHDKKFIFVLFLVLKIYLYNSVNPIMPTISLSVWTYLFFPNLLWIRCNQKKKEKKKNSVVHDWNVQKCFFFPNMTLKWHCCFFLPGRILKEIIHLSLFPPKSLKNCSYVLTPCRYFGCVKVELGTVWINVTLGLPVY